MHDADISRRQRLLAVLEANPEGATLAELGDVLGEEGRVASRSRVVALRTMCKQGWVERGLHRGGAYLITEAGRLALDARAVATVPVVLSTGSMAGESRRVVRSMARAGQVRPRGVNWVFGLAGEGAQA